MPGDIPEDVVVVGEPKFKATVENGKVVVDYVYVALEQPAMVLFEADLKTKYAKVLPVAGSEVVLVTRPESLHFDEPADEFTRVTFKMPKGWQIFLAECQRYTLSVLAVDWGDYEKEVTDIPYLWERKET